MPNAGTEYSPSDEYMMRIVVAALTKCEDEDQAAQLVAQQVALYPRIDQVIEHSGELSEGKQYQRAIALLDEMIGRTQQFTRPYPVEAVQEVFGYAMVRLYFLRAVIQFGGATEASDLAAVLADLDRAQRYPTATFVELDPEILVAMDEFRTIVAAALTGQKAFEQRQVGKSGASAQSGNCFIATAAYGSACAPEVVTLRCFREDRLRPYPAGRWLIHVYERCSPPLAAAIASRPTARLWVRRLLLGPIISLVRGNGFDAADWQSGHSTTE